MGGPALIDGEIYEECDNFYVINFKVDGVTYPTAEHYFQCQKTFIQNERDFILSKNSALNAWIAGNKVTLRSDWERIKVNVMYEGNKARFEQNSDIAKTLCLTKGNVSFEGSTPFWNFWNGKIIERIRAELRGNEEDKKDLEELISLFKQYEESL